MTRNNALTISVAALVLGLSAAACGGNGNSPSVASASGDTTTNSSSATTPSSGSTPSGDHPSGGNLVMGGGNPEQMRKLSACIRAHGVPNFPDPNADGSISVSGINPDSPSFRNAMNACKKYQPNGGQPPSPQQQAKMQEQALKYSACMRAHGLPNFPDPAFHNGGVSLRINKSVGSSPTFQRAQAACAKNLPGQVQSLGKKGAQ
jgi:hypothetical protein